MTMNHTATPQPQARPGHLVLGSDFLSFRLGADEYGIDIQRVREIRSYEAPTRVAHLPAAIKGVVNLRGVIVQIVDLRMVLECEHCEYDTLTAVIMLNLHSRIVGAVVDSVSDVLELGPESIRPPPPFATGSGRWHIGGVGHCADRTVLLLDIEALMAHADGGITLPRC